MRYSYVAYTYMNDQCAMKDNSVAMKYCSYSMPTMHVRMLLYEDNIYNNVLYTIIKEVSSKYD